MGPPFWNLGRPVAISAHGSPVEFTVEELDTPLVRPRSIAADRRLSITRVLLDENCRGRTIDLRFRFRDFRVNAVCRPVPLMGTTCERADLTLSTLQKDNDVQWIRDWCVWHHRVHGVSRIVIYDNNSANVDDVRENLSRLAGPELVLVRWNFPYGPYSPQSRKLPSPLHFAQTGALNHCRMVFGGCTDWCVNLDVDEYLYNGGDAPLLQHLRDRKYRNRSVVYLRFYTVPMTQDVTPRRCFDSPLRSRALAGGPMKYICRPEKTEVNGIHRLTPTTRWRALRAARSCAMKLLMLAGLFRIGRMLSTTARRITGRLDDVGLRPRTCRREDALFFFHFEALNTGWSRERRVHSPHPRSVVADDRIGEMKAMLEDMP